MSSGRRSATACRFPSRWSRCRREAGTGQISGIVHDRADQPLFGAHIVAQSLTTGIEVGAMSGVVEGPFVAEAYELLGLPSDQYQVRVEPIDGSAPGFVSVFNFGGIDQALVPAKFLSEVDLSTVYHRLVFEPSLATPVTLIEGDAETVVFRPMAFTKKLPKFIRTSIPFNIEGVLNADVTGPLQAASLNYTVDNGAPNFQTSNTLSSSLSVLDAESLATLTTIPLSGEPRYISVMADGSTAVVTMSGDDDVAFVDVGSDAVVALGSSGLSGLYFLAPCLPDGNVVLAGKFQIGSNRLAVIDVPGQSVATIDLGTSVDTTAGLAFHPDGERGYVVNYLVPELVEFDVATGNVHGRFTFDSVNIRDLSILEETGVTCFNVPPPVDVDSKKKKAIIAASKKKKAIAASIKNKRHKLTWQDNSDNEDGFKIERKQDGTFAEVAQVGPNISTYVDVLTTGLEQCYRVRAFNASGNSGYTNEGCTLPEPS